MAFSLSEMSLHPTKLLSVSIVCFLYCWFYSIVWVHHSLFHQSPNAVKHIQFVSSVGLLLIKLQRTLCPDFMCTLIFISLEQIPRGVIAGLYVQLLKKLPNKFTILHYHQQCMRLTRPHQPLIISVVFYFSNLLCSQWYLIMSLICICFSMMANDIGHSFIKIYILSMVKCLFSLLIFLLLSLESSLYILDLSTL